MEYRYRTVENKFPTSLARDGELALREVSGQMSDGIWENTNGYDRYWMTFDVLKDGDLSVWVGRYYCDNFYRKEYLNPYYGKSDAEVRKFFAQKIKQVCKEFLQPVYGYHGESTPWRRDNNDIVPYFGDGKMTVARIYAVYDWLMGREVKA